MKQKSGVNGVGKADPQPQGPQVGQGVGQGAHNQRAALARRARDGGTTTEGGIQSLGSYILNPSIFISIDIQRGGIDGDI